MMRIGQRHWGWVSTDTAGVPHGGPFGDVERFERAAKRHGLILGWSQRCDCFGVCTRLGPTKWVCQMLLQNGDKPIPCSDALLSLLLIAWERHSRYSADTITDYIVQLERDRKSALAKELYEERKEMAMDVTVETFRSLGMETRPLISIPRSLEKKIKRQHRWQRQLQSGRRQPSRLNSVAN